jgi:molybdopterin molybdotransferase
VVGVDEALRLVLDAAVVRPPVEIPLEAAGGRRLASEIRASCDMPRFDRTAMDGYAVRAADVAEAPVVLEVVEDLPAGKDPSRSVGAGQASRIMTGAAIPPGADAVVMVEETEILEEGRRVRILSPSAEGRHIRRAGEDLRAGDLLLEPGTCVGPAEAALLAAEGRATVAVRALPAVALLSTGDELVPIEEAPAGSRIRETNSWSLRGLIRALGIEPRLLGIVRDEEAPIRRAIREGLRSDVLLVTGGVSMGAYDLVGRCLEQEGCRAVFERVAIQPGKPLFFGRSGRSPASLVFGLPGNPVSSIVDFLVFVRPALRKMLGDPRPVDPLPSARLAGSVRRHAGRRGYLPARVMVDPDGGLAVTPVPSMGSADLVALSRANALVIAPEGRSEIPPGERLRVILLGALTSA